VEHAASIAGRGRTGLGSDFDGGFAPAECAAGCGRPEELPALADALAAAGWDAAALAGFRHGNWMRTLRAALSRTSTGR
jgi:microsomal dipeptidase-like Zn-dependent dipeptidase